MMNEVIQRLIDIEVGDIVTYTPNVNEYDYEVIEVTTFYLVLKRKGERAVDKRTHSKKVLINTLARYRRAYNLKIRKGINNEIHTT